MKMVMALIRNECLSQVQEALMNAGFTAFTVSATLGVQKLPGSPGPSGQQGIAHHIRLEAAVPDSWVHWAVDILREAATTGQPGDGVIFVYDLERAVKIRTGEEGDPILIPELPVSEAPRR